MKHGKRPTRKQKALLISNRKDPANWLYVREEAGKSVFIHRKTDSLLRLAL